MKNVGGIDKVIRVISGLGLLSLFFILEGKMRYWGLIGVVPLITAVIGYCPLYSVFGIKTCKLQNK